MNSGLDTEAIVRAMTANTMLRINNNQRRVLRLQSQQESYREVIGKLQNFQNTYFRFGANFLRNPSTFNQVKATTTVNGEVRTPAGVTISAGANATRGSYEVTLLNNATRTTMTGSAFQNENAAVDLNALGVGHHAMNVRIGDVSRNISFEVTNAGNNASKVDAINEALRGAFGMTNTPGVGIVTMNASGAISSVNSGAITVSNVIGMQDNHAFAVDFADMTAGNNSFNVQVGNVFRTINFASVEAGHFDILYNDTGTRLSTLSNEDRADYLAGVAQDRFVAAQAQAWTDWEGSSADTPASRTQMRAFAYAQAHGVNAPDEATVDDWMTTIGLTDQEAFNVNFAFNPTTRLAVFRTQVNNEYNAATTRINLIPEDVRDTMTQAEAVATFNHNRFTTALNAQSWGTVPGTTPPESIKVEFAGGQLTSTDGRPIAVTRNASSANDFGLTELTAQSATVSGTATLGAMNLLGGADTGTITINGVDIELRANMNVNQMVTAVTNSAAGVTMTFSSLDNNFTLTSKTQGAGQEITVTNSAITNRLGLTSGTANATANNGLNMRVDINGQIIETASNSHTIDGTTFTFGPNAAEGANAVTFNVEVAGDTSRAAEVIKNFVNDYNALIKDVFAMLNERPNRKFHFLTENDIDESGMSDREIERWEREAKKGLMFNNSAVSSVMSGMRTAMMSSVVGANGQLFNIFNIRGNDGTHAMRPVADFRENGRLEFNEAALIEALERNPEDIIALFTGENGLMVKLEQQIDRAISTNIGREGTLVSRAGSATGRTAIQNSISEQINGINRTIDTLQGRYNRQQERFWRMFSAMESQFASLNSQSSQLAGMFNNVWG